MTQKQAKWIVKSAITIWLAIIAAIFIIAALSGCSTVETTTKQADIAPKVVIDCKQAVGKFDVVINSIFVTHANCGGYF